MTYEVGYVTIKYMTRKKLGKKTYIYFLWRVDYLLNSLNLF